MADPNPPIAHNTEYVFLNFIDKTFTEVYAINETHNQVCVKYILALNTNEMSLNFFPYKSPNRYGLICPGRLYALSALSVLFHCFFLFAVLYGLL